MSVKKMRNYLKIYTFFLITTIAVVAHPQPQEDKDVVNEVLNEPEILDLTEEDATPLKLEDMIYGK